MALKIKVKEDIQEFAVNLSGGDQVFELVNEGSVPGDKTKDIEMYLTYGTHPIVMDHNNHLGLATATTVRITKINSANYKIEYVKRDDGTIYHTVYFDNVPDTGNMFCLSGYRPISLRINGRVGYRASGATAPPFYQYMYYGHFSLISYEGSTIGLSSMLNATTSWKSGTDYGTTTAYTKASDLKYTLNMSPYPDVPAEAHLDGTITPTTPLPKLDTSYVILHQPNEITLHSGPNGKLTLDYSTSGYHLPPVDGAVTLLLYIPKNCTLGGILTSPKHNTSVGPYAMVIQRSNLANSCFLNGVHGTVLNVEVAQTLTVSPNNNEENILPNAVVMGYAENGISTVPVIYDWSNYVNVLPVDSTPAEIRSMTDLNSGTIISRPPIEQVDLPYELVGKFNTVFRGAVYAIDEEEI